MPKVTTSYNEFLKTAKPQQLSKLIDLLEQDPDHDFNELALTLKKVTFIDLLTILNINKCVLNKTGKGYRTHLHIGDETGKLLVLSQKDSQDLDSTYVRLYDKHKNELLRIIECHESVGSGYRKTAEA